MDRAPDFSSSVFWKFFDNSTSYLASHAGVFREKKRKRKREEKRAPLKTPAWEATSYPRRHRPPNPRVGLKSRPPILVDIPGCIESLVARETRCNVRRETKWRTSGKVCPRFDLGVDCFSFRDIFGHY